MLLILKSVLWIVIIRRFEVMIHPAGVVFRHETEVSIMVVHGEVGEEERTGDGV